MKDRLEAARKLSQLEELPGPLLVDSMEDQANKMFGAYPDRLYIIYKGNVAYQSGYGPFGYKVEDLEEWLQTYKANLLNSAMKTT